MVSNLVVRNARTGYVTFVAKARVGGESRTVEYICGLGNMDQVEFKHFQHWAHSIKDQQMRRDRVLACPMVVEEGKTIRGKVAAETQKKTTVKRPPKKVVVKAKIRQPVSMVGYKGLSKGMSHTEIMMERKRDEKASKRLKKYIKTKKVDDTYKIRDLTRAQELEAEIKTLKGNKADKKLIRERQVKIKSILGKKYKTCREVATAAQKGDVVIDAS